jgi:hypothetical protein
MRTYEIDLKGLVHLQELTARALARGAAARNEDFVGPTKRSFVKQTV